jgi:hypothetical protein
MTDGSVPRLFEADSGAPDELRGLLDAAHTDVLSRDAIVRVTAGVEQALGPRPGPGPSGAAPAAPWSALAKIAGILVIGGVVIAALALRRPSAPAATAPPTAPSTSEEAPKPVVPTPIAPSADSDGLPATAVEPIASAAPSATLPSRRRATPAPTSSAAPAPPSPGSPGSPGSTTTVMEEHLLLRRARAALQTDPQAALALTREHERRFPQGMLIEEREVIAIEAMARSGSADDARTRLRRFKAEYPTSVHGRELDREVLETNGR